MATYIVNFRNNSQNQGSACLFQQQAGASYGQVFSLAWFAQNSFPGSQNSFQWNTDYSFVWAQTGMLVPGVMFSAAQQINADPLNNNSITFMQQYGGFQFGPLQRGWQQGTFSVQSDTSVPPNQASVGIGMSGSGTFATQAQPNMVNTFSANTTYWLTFGNYQQGQVLSTDQISNLVELNFAGGTSLTVTLNPDNTFTVQPG